jgi:hypothetical protein
MSTVPRIPSAVPGWPVSFATALAHAPAVARAFAQLYAAFWNDPLVGHRLKEIARIRNARLVDCRY